MDCEKSQISGLQEIQSHWITNKIKSSGLHKPVNKKKSEISGLLEIPNQWITRNPKSTKTGGGRCRLLLKISARTHLQVHVCVVCTKYDRVTG